MKRIIQSVVTLTILYLLIYNNGYSQNINNNYDSTFEYNRNISDATYNGDNCINDTICISNNCDFLMNYFGIKRIDLNKRQNKETSNISRVFFRTKNGREYLKVVKTPISSYCTYFEVGYVYTLKKISCLPLPFNTLITDYEIKLGMSEQSFLKKKGLLYNEKKKRSNTIVYLYKWDTNGSQYGSTYICFYKFQNSKLVKYGLGISDRLWN